MPAVNLSPLTFRSDALQLLGRDGKKDAKQEREKNRKKHSYGDYISTLCKCIIPSAYMYSL